jgi:Ca-activated chloride channel homolog
LIQFFAGRYMSRTSQLKQRRGATLPLMAIMLPVALILSAFAINLAYVELCRTEMYVSADAAARAGGREFALTGSQASARTKARAAAAVNTVAGRPMQLRNSDFSFGEASRSGMNTRYNFNSGGPRPNAIEITANYTNTSINGALRMPFPLLSATTVQSTQTARANQIEVDVALVVDKSGSMAYASDEVAQYPPLPASAPPGWFFCDPAPPNSRWLDLESAVDVFLTELSTSPISEQVSLTTYSSGAHRDVNLTTNYQTIRDSINWYSDNFCSGTTNIGGGINEGRNSLAHANARGWAAKVMIVMTDGIDTVGSNPIAAAEDAAEEQIMIFTITFSDEADQATMQTVAAKGFGKHYHAANGAGLTAIFRDIARQLPTLLTR